MHRWNETIQTGSDMRTRIFYSLAGVALAGAMAFVMPTEVQAAANPDGSVDINSTNFPDPVFEANLRTSTYDKDGNGILSAEEIADIAELSLSSTYTGMTISSLEGIQYLTALESLICSGNELTTLDLSQNKALRALSCDDNNLTSLNISGLTALEEIYCKDNYLASIDVSGLTALETLSCGGNNLTTLDVSGLTALEILRCEENELTVLNASGCTALQTLTCNKNNALASLDVSGCTALRSLNCSSCLLTSLDVSSCTALTALSCNYNTLTSLDVSNNTSLSSLQCRNNGLTSLDLSQNTNLSLFNCSDNELTALVLGNNSKISGQSFTGGTIMVETKTVALSSLPGKPDANRIIAVTGGTISGDTLTFNSGSDTMTYTYDCGNNNTLTVTLNKAYGIEITEENFPDAAFRAYIQDNFDKDSDLVLSQEELDAVTTIMVQIKGITSLEGIQYFTNLVNLNCSGNQLTSLDVRKNKNLKWLGCGNNQLTSLNVTQNTALTYLQCNDNKLQTLDLSKNTALSSLTITGNNLTALDLGNNNSLTSGKFYNPTATYSIAGYSIALSALPGQPEASRRTCSARASTQDSSISAARSQRSRNNNKVHSEYQYNRRTGHMADAPIILSLFYESDASRYRLCRICSRTRRTIVGLTESSS